MIFDEFRLDQAIGLILAHSLRLPDGAFKKGRQLSAEDVRRLQEAGLSTVIGARLEAGDVPEDEAADRVAAAIVGDNVIRSAAFTGRSNLFAATRGLVVIDRQRVDALNRIDEAVTVATVAPGDIVVPRQMVATIKIIPFAVPAAALERCLAFAAGAEGPIAVRPFQPHRVGLILTTLPGTKESVIEGTTAATRMRIEGLGGSLVVELRCPHRTAALAEAVAKAMAADCTLLLISGASANVDRRDVVPAAVVAAGGSVVHFGMPVDPGNLMLLARIGSVPVVGLPGCARSVKPNGLDWVLRRLMV